MNAHDSVAYAAQVCVVDADREKGSRWVGLGWTSADPYVVAVVFLGVKRDPDVEWVIGRELLADGLTAPAGLADVRVSPAPGEPDEVLVALSTPSGEADIYFDADDLAEFLTATDGVVPIGEELAYVSIDAAIEALIADESGWYGTGEAA